MDVTKTQKVLQEIFDERVRQDEKWGEQNHPNGTSEEFRRAAEIYKRLYELGDATWDTILAEEVYEARTETEDELLRKELIQVAAVACNWIECIDRRKEK
jgi:hypothetical protein